MSHLRKKKSTFDESELPTDGWMWGNTRGGGGAPLKDPSGNNVANLKQVLAGNLEVDHSPSPKGKQAGRPRPDRGNYNDYSDDEYENRNNNRSYGRNDRDDDRRRDSRDRQEPPRNRRGRDDYDEEERVIPGLTNLPKVGKGGYRDAVDDRDDRRRDAPLKNPSPNKKFMGGVAELNGHTASMQSDKLRKQQEYQDMLRQQIEEKNKVKAKEKREEDEIKRREWEEYMVANGGKVQNKAGNANAPNGANRPPRFREEESDQDSYRGKKGGVGGGVALNLDNLNQHNKGGGHEGGRRNRGGDSDYDEPAPRGGGGGRNLPPRGRRDGDSDDDRAAPRRGGGGRDRDSNYDSENDRYSDEQDRRGGGGGKSFVSAEEYDELSRLVDDLLAQKESLQLEVREKDNLLSTLRKGGPVAGKAQQVGGSVQQRAGAASLQRSKSAVHARGGRKSEPIMEEEIPIKPASKSRIEMEKERARQERERLKEFAPKKNVGGSDKKAARDRSQSVNNKPRPSSMYAKTNDIHDPAAAGRRPIPKAAFGSNNDGNTKEARLAKGKALLAEAGNNIRGGARRSSEPDRDYGGGGGGGVNGFAKLQANGGPKQSKVMGGPVLVVHEEDEDYGGRGGGGGRNAKYNHNANTPSPLRRGGGGGANRMSAGELRGESHYIRGGDDVANVFSGGDQLDRMLNRARGARN